MSHRRASKLSVKLVAKPCRELNNRKSLADKSPKNWQKYVDGIESNTQKYRNLKARQSKNNAERTISFCEWKHFDLISIKMKATAKAVEHNKWQLRCVCVCVGGPQQTLEPRLESLSILALPSLGLPCLALPYPAQLLIKCQIASISAGHMWRTPTHSNRNCYSYSSSAVLYIWIIEFEFGIEWSLLPIAAYSLPTIQFKRLFATQSLAENVVVNTQRAELSDGRSFISFGWRVRASHAQSAKCCLPACQWQLLRVKHQSVPPPPHPLLFASLPACLAATA